MPWDFEQFVKERKFLHNVSPRTIEWYEQTFNWLRRYEPSESGVKAFVIGMREGGLKAISCNSRIRVANAYFKWAGLPLHINRLKEEHRVLPTFTADQLSRIITFKPSTFYHKRLHALVLTLFDSGLRIEEALGLLRSHIDFDNFLLTITGKGDKQRVIPFSNELRKILFRWCGHHRHDVVFPTLDGGKLDRRVVLRDFKILCRKLKFEPPPRTLHAIRHTFATNYIRRGGSQFMLMKVLGHTSLEMTKKYVNFQTEDLSAVHNRLSPLSVQR
jgi:integrase/recombinase XerD